MTRLINGRVCAVLLSALTLSLAATADDDHGGMMPMHASGHAPLGVMADHMHKRGEWMFSYRYMYMDMEGNRDGDNGISPDNIATTIPNRFFGNPMQPPTLRVVPLDMRMDMHMFGAMYAPTDWVTLMLMTSYIEKEMDHQTYIGPAGATVRGEFTTRSDGIGDTSVSGMFRLWRQGPHKAHVNFGISIPTGTNTERDTILTPLGTTPEVRLPYAMQIGSGTVDLLPGITYTGKHQKIGWGAQYSARVRTGSDEGYSLGDKHEATAWMSYEPIPAFSLSARVRYQNLGDIDGMDSSIMGPVQTADPDNYGGRSTEILVGANLAGQNGWWRKKRLAIEIGFPVHRELNGPQMETDLTVNAGLQVAF